MHMRPRRGPLREPGTSYMCDSHNSISELSALGIIILEIRQKQPKLPWLRISNDSASHHATNATMRLLQNLNKEKWLSTLKSNLCSSCCLANDMSNCRHKNNNCKAYGYRQTPQSHRLRCRILSTWLGVCLISSSDEWSPSCWCWGWDGLRGDWCR